MILDLHTHAAPPSPEAIISADPEVILELSGRFPNQLWSVGVHPWALSSAGLSAAQTALLEKVASLPQVVAVGEIGLDEVHGSAPLFMQVNAFRQQVEVADKVCKPVIIHAVKSHDLIISLHKELKPATRWVIHGFRAKPTVVRQYAKHGIGLSFGEHFNADSLMAAPLDSIFAETDDSTTEISAVIEEMHRIRPEITTALIAANTATLISE